MASNCIYCTSMWVNIPLTVVKIDPLNSLNIAYVASRFRFGGKMAAT